MHNGKEQEELESSGASILDPTSSNKDGTGHGNGHVFYVFLI